MKAMNRVVVPQFRVAFVAKTGVSARGGAGLANLGQSTGFNRTITQAQSARVDMMLGNVDYALMQGLAEQLHADFLKRLAAGKQVVSLDEMKKSSGYPKIEPVKLDKPYVKSPFDDRASSSSPPPRSCRWPSCTSTPIWAARGLSTRTPPRRSPSLGATLDALVLIPTVIVDFAQLESSGNSRFATSAEASATPKVGISARPC
jgi:hypothetical protein